MEKICIVCGKDVSNTKRVKNLQGQYYCQECSQRAYRQQQIETPKYEAPRAPAPIIISRTLEPNASRLSKLALFAFILGLLSFCLGILAGIPALILGCMALSAIKKNPFQLHGRGLAVTGNILASIGIILSILVTLVLIPSLGRAGELANRSACAANLTSIIKSMIVYANENGDVYPTSAIKPKDALTYTVTPGTVSERMLSYDTLPWLGNSNNTSANVASTMWMTVLNQQTTPIYFLCKSDRFITPTIPSRLTDNNEKWLIAFEDSAKFSYSIAYPWNSSGTNVARYWCTTVDSSLPIMSDMAPTDVTGNPLRDVTPADIATVRNVKTLNSFNHGGDGQNVGFADAHVEWARRPDVGQQKDNIWTSQNAPHAVINGRIPASKSEEKIPYDIIMVPTRNGDTGQVE